MNDFNAGDRVRCVDATPLPMNAAWVEAGDFTFPDGFIAEGEIYVVEGVFPPVGGSASLMLAEKRVLMRGREIPWCGARFRPLDGEAVHVDQSATHSRVRRKHSIAVPS